MATAVLSSATPFPSLYCCSSRSPAPFYPSPTIVLVPRNPRYHFSGSIPQLGLALISPWSGLKHLGISSRQNYGQKKKKEKWRGRVVYASLFGVGAPEALVIGVVALLVFGPKGLAEVARTLGKTLRAFQPTIREIQEVSRDFKSSLEREIGLDEVSSSSINTYRSTSFVNENQQGVVDPNGTATTKPYTSEELLKVTEDQVAASSIRPEKEAALNPDGQSQVPSEIAPTTTEAPSSPTSPEAAVQLQQPSEKAEK